jgi:hypothetical protein
MDDQALDAILRERLAPLRQVDEAPSQVRSIMDTLDKQTALPRITARSHDWLLLAAWLLATLVALPLLSQLDLAAVSHALTNSPVPAPTTLLSLGAALLVGLLVYPMLSD